MTVRRNYHASAIVLGTRGFLLLGASGSGKSSLALCLTAEASARGLYAAFVGDDQVFLERESDAIIAHSIHTIEGLAEVRGGDIVAVPAIAAAMMDFAIAPVSRTTADRLPPENEVHDLEGLGSLPLLRLPAEAKRPLDILLRLAQARPS